ncbi:MAG: rhomboid family intramembrane serine protease [Candidatus Brocadiaceae bacterium]|jgi:membrane associated rhomboid family serine protease
MLPLRDRNPSGIVPWVVYGLIAVNCLAFFIEISLPEEALREVMNYYGVVPGRVTDALTGGGNLLGAVLVPAFTSMFLHGGWAHLLGNMWFLYIFGDNVEGRLGHLSFLLFYIGCGLCATTAQYVLRPHSGIPTIGASGAIAGALGAYAACWPRARILTLVPVFFFLHFIELPAVFVLGMWFLVQFLQGTASLGVTFAHGGVAYWAHVGGFLAGLILVKVWPTRRAE